MMIYDQDFDNCIDLPSFQRMLVTKPWNSSLSPKVCEIVLASLRESTGPMATNAESNVNENDTQEHVECIQPTENECRAERVAMAAERGSSVAPLSIEVSETPSSPAMFSTVVRSGSCSCGCQVCVILVPRDGH